MAGAAALAAGFYVLDRKVRTLLSSAKRELRDMSDTARVARRETGGVRRRKRQKERGAKERWRKQASVCGGLRKNVTKREHLAQNTTPLVRWGKR